MAYFLMMATMYLAALVLHSLSRQYYHLNSFRRPPPKPPFFFRLIVTNKCLYTSALVVVELGRYLYP